MTYMQKPKFRHPALARNKAGLTRRDYEGTVSTLCAGCGHDSVSAAIIEACYQLDLPGHRVAKLSGIGCSSKTPTYFLNKAHGFNGVHGRMPAIATGANLANRDLIYIGVSGDGDTASIGLGQFAHAVRRRLNLTYIVENNGTYGLTKGQFSATNDKNSRSKRGQDNPFGPIDLCALAIELGAGFVARGFSGDKEQLVPMIKAALAYRGFAFIDVISPCVTFNNHAYSTKSYDYVRHHNEAVDKLDFVPEKAEISVDYAEGETKRVQMHDGTEMALHKLDTSYDPYDAATSLASLYARRMAGEVVTGVLYLDGDQTDLHDVMKTTGTPLNQLDPADMCPGQAGLDKVNGELR